MWLITMYGYVDNHEDMSYLGYVVNNHAYTVYGRNWLWKSPFSKLLRICLNICKKMSRNSEMRECSCFLWWRGGAQVGSWRSAGQTIQQTWTAARSPWSKKRIVPDFTISVYSSTCKYFCFVPHSRFFVFSIQFIDIPEPYAECDAKNR